MGKSKQPTPKWTVLYEGRVLREYTTTRDTLLDAYETFTTHQLKQVHFRAPNGMRLNWQALAMLVVGGTQ